MLPQIRYAKIHGFHFPLTPRDAFLPISVVTIVTIVTTVTIVTIVVAVATIETIVTIVTIGDNARLTSHVRKYITQHERRTQTLRLYEK